MAAIRILRDALKSVGSPTIQLYFNTVHGDRNLKMAFQERSFHYMSYTGRIFSIAWPSSIKHIQSVSKTGRPL